MSNWKCENCDRDLDELQTVNTTYEDYYGVATVFPFKTPLTLSVCPYCQQDEGIVEVEVEEDENE